MRSFFLFILGLLGSLYVTAHTDSLALPKNDTSLVQISVLTCERGDELYASFGHSAIRVVDGRSGTDEVYNYGTFQFSDPEFYSKFVRGKLPYYLDKGSYRDFMSTYIAEKRSVKEQVLQLSSEEESGIRSYLENNLLPENRAYPYDFLFDNCATRVRDLFPEVLGAGFYYADILDGKKASYRNAINQYLADKHWERFGINLLLGSKVDSLMTDEGSMFLPHFLYKGLSESMNHGKRLVKEERALLTYEHVPKGSWNGAMWAMVGVLLITVLSYLVRPFAYLKRIVRFVILFSTGLLGCLMLFMWLGTAHESCANNFNILWAFPANVAIAFMANKKGYFLKLYALAGISMLIVSLAIHLIGIQRMPLIELSPIFLCLMYIYVDLYKSNLGQSLRSHERQEQRPTLNEQTL